MCVNIFTSIKFHRVDDIIDQNLASCHITEVNQVISLCIKLNDCHSRLELAHIQLVDNSLDKLLDFVEVGEANGTRAINQNHQVQINIA